MDSRRSTINSQPDEFDPLLPDSHEPSCLHKALENLKIIAPRILPGCDRLLASVNSLAIVQAILYPMLAFPTIDKVLNRVINPMGIALLAATLTIHIAAEHKYEFQVRGITLSVESIKQKLSALINSTNTFNFALGTYIAVYIAAVALLRHIGENQVNVSDTAYLAAFVLPSLLVAAAHGLLDIFKEKWVDATHGIQYVMRLVHHGIMALYNSSNLNSAALTVAAIWGVSEGNHVNPFDRLGLFTLALLAGLTLAIISANKKSADAIIERFINFTCAITYLANTLGSNARKSNGDVLTNLFLISYTVTAVTSFVSALFFPHKEPTPALAVDVENTRPVERVTPISVFMHRESNPIPVRQISPTLSPSHS